MALSLALRTPVPGVGRILSLPTPPPAALLKRSKLSSAGGGMAPPSTPIIPTGSIHFMGASDIDLFGTTTTGTSDLAELLGLG